MIQHTEHEEDHQGNAEIDGCLHIFGEQEQILRHVYLWEYIRVPKKRAHTAARCIGEEGEYDITAEKVDRVVRYRSAEKALEYDAHNKKCEQRREHAPQHTEIGSFIFFLKVALYKLGK